MLKDIFSSRNKNSYEFSSLLGSWRIRKRFTFLFTIIMLYVYWGLLRQYPPLPSSHHTPCRTPICLWIIDKHLIISYFVFFNRPAEAEALLGEPNERRRNLQQQHSLSGITDQPDLTASIRWVIYWTSE